MKFLLKMSDGCSEAHEVATYKNVSSASLSISTFLSFAWLQWHSAEFENTEKSEQESAEQERIGLFLAENDSRRPSDKTFKC